MIVDSVCGGRDRTKGGNSAGRCEGLVIVNRVGFRAQFRNSKHDSAVAHVLVNGFCLGRNDA